MEPADGEEKVYLIITIFSGTKKGVLILCLICRYLPKGWIRCFLTLN